MTNIPAFFSCNVNSFQSLFMRSRRAIHRSACSCGGIASHRFSMLASVGLEMACACRVWRLRVVGMVAVVRRKGEEDAERWWAEVVGRRASAVRNMAGSDGGGSGLVDVLMDVWTSAPV